MMEYVLGVDGGATKTDYMLFTTSGVFAGHVRGGPGNHEVYTDGYTGAGREYSKSLNKLFQKAGISTEQVVFSVWGLGGVDIDDQRIRTQEIVSEMGLSRHIVCNDGFLGIKAGSNSGFGICSINGTGTSCVGIDPSGSTLQIGGTGLLFGDEAGGSALGGWVVRSVYDSVFRCGKSTSMKEMLFHELGICDGDDLVTGYYREIINGEKSTADLNAILFHAALDEDACALEILDSVGVELGKSIIGMLNYLDFSTTRAVEIVLAGSIYRKAEHPGMVHAMKRFVQTHTHREQEYIFNVLDAQPVAGAVIWALEESRGCPLNAAEKDSIIKACI
ncbi:MAG: hypothetical protein HQ557_19345 [Bacteroidetes bacterium]|nr:hypothetical protein [Bacteroidota bacterium]